MRTYLLLVFFFCFSLRALEFWLSHLLSQKGERTVTLKVHYSFGRTALKQRHSQLTYGSNR